jgi:hypothetical protein
MSFVPYYLQILKEGKTPLQSLNEDMGDPNEETPIALLKLALPFLQELTAFGDSDRDSALRPLIAKIEALVGSGSKMSDQDVWRTEMHGGQRPPAHKQILGSASHE